jgi:hypothetical protein
VGDLLKFSYRYNPQLPTSSSLIPDSVRIGTGDDRRYPAASPTTFVSLATKIASFSSTGFAPPEDFIVPPNGSVEVRLFHNGVAVPGWLITYGPGEGGIKLLPAPPPEAFVAGDEFALQVFSSGFSSFDFPRALLFSATIGTV